MGGKEDIAVLEEDEESNKLPDTWPSGDALKSNRVNFFNLQDDKLIQFYKKTLNEDLCVYPMKHLIRGNVIIINNENFLKLPSRRGTEHDRQKIEAVFTQLGFNVIVYNNLKTCEMQTTLLRESRADYSKHDCFILFILSHGDRGVVLGIDGDREDGSAKLSITHMKRMFSENKSLLGKPKLFFLQCCQGSKLDTGNTRGTLDDETIESSYLKVRAAATPSEQTDSGPSEKSRANSSDDEERPNGPNISSEADIFLSTSSVKGYVSWRNAETGSWYIQAIAYVFRKFAYKENLSKLMMMVNNLVSKSEAGERKFKQVATVNSTLTKDLYFFPRLNETNVTLTEKLSQEIILRKSLQIELASQKEKYDDEKRLRQSLENELKKQAKTIAQLQEKVDSQKKKRKIAEKRKNELEKGIDPSCRQCKHSANSGSERGFDQSLSRNPDTWTQQLTTTSRNADSVSLGGPASNYQLDDCSEVNRYPRTSVTVLSHGDQQYRMIQTYFCTLKENIRAEEFTDKMHQEGILSIEEKQDIDQMHGINKRKDALFDAIHRYRNKGSVDIFLEILQEKYTPIYESWKSMYEQRYESITAPVTTGEEVMHLPWKE